MDVQFPTTCEDGHDGSKYADAVWAAPVKSFDDILARALIALDWNMPACGESPSPSDVIDALLASDYYDEKSIGHLAKAILEYRRSRDGA